MPVRLPWSGEGDEGVGIVGRRLVLSFRICPPIYCLVVVVVVVVKKAGRHRKYI